MACSSCKNKTNYKDDIQESVKTTQKAVIAVIIVWFLLGCYGVYSLVTKLI